MSTARANRPLPATGPFLVTGFGPFGPVDVNPSGAMARWADGARIAGRAVVGRELRVSFAAVPSALAELVDEHEPAAIVALGVQREDWWRLERRALRPLTSLKADVDGVVALEHDRAARPAERRTVLDVDALANDLVEAGFTARASDDAGGYVCEWCYGQALEHGERLGVPALFIHVPPEGAEVDARRDQALGLVLGAIERHLGAAPRG